MVLSARVVLITASIMNEGTVSISESSELCHRPPVIGSNAIKVGMPLAGVTATAVSAVTREVRTSVKPGAVHAVAARQLHKTLGSLAVAVKSV